MLFYYLHSFCPLPDIPTPLKVIELHRRCNLFDSLGPFLIVMIFQCIKLNPLLVHESAVTKDQFMTADCGGGNRRKKIHKINQNNRNNDVVQSLWYRTCLWV